MRQLVTAFGMILLLSSCLKQSIADAILADQNAGVRGGSPAVATMTYQINGNTVTNSVADPDTQSPTLYQLGCSKTVNPGTNSTSYGLDCVTGSGEFTFTFSTDSLIPGNYLYTGNYGELFITDYNNADEFVYYPGDSISFNVTSYLKGHISGNFSGRLTPITDAGSSSSTYGTPGSVLITNGSFKDVPVFY